MEQLIIDILVKKIKEQEVNPKTGQPYKIEDIKIREYKDAVNAILNTTT